MSRKEGTWNEQFVGNKQAWLKVIPPSPPSLCRLRLRGQAPGDAVAQPRGLGQAQHRDEADDLRLRAEGGDEGARPHRVLGQPDHLLRRRPKLPEGLLLDLPVSKQVHAERASAGNK